MKSSQTTPRLVMIWEHLRLLNERAGSCSLLETPTGDQGDASRHDVLDATNAIWEILDLGFHPKIHKVVDLHIHWLLQLINVGTYRHGDLIPRSIGRGIDHTWQSLGSMKRHSPCNKHHSDPIPKSMVDKLFIIFFYKFSKNVCNWLPTKHPLKLTNLERVVYFRFWLLAQRNSHIYLMVRITSRAACMAFSGTRQLQIANSLTISWATWATLFPEDRAWHCWLITQIN
jgi:hypothetical protein